MSLLQYFRHGSRGSIWTRATLASIALLGILAARSVPTQFPRALGGHSTISADSHHDQRPRFDHADSQWSAPANGFLPTPPAAKSTQLAPVPQLFSSLQTKGFRYNRPPPIC
jgi:hypothetical protein